MEVEIVYPKDARKDLLDQSTLISKWIKRVNQQFVIKKIVIESIDLFPGPRIGFIELTVDYLYLNHSYKERFVLSGKAVSIVLLAKVPENGLIYTLLVEQPRLGVGKLVKEFPAGMVDDSEDYKGVALKELEEECGIVAEGDELVQIGDFLYSDPSSVDDSSVFFIYKRNMSLEELDGLNNRVKGDGYDEQITTHVIPLTDVPNTSSDLVTISMAYQCIDMIKEGKITFE